MRSMRKATSIAMSFLLVGLICVPAPAMTALADEISSGTPDPQATESTETAISETAAPTTTVGAENPTSATEATEDSDSAETEGEATDPGTATTQATTDNADDTDEPAGVTTPEELASAFAAANAQANGITYEITLGADIATSDLLSLESGKSMTIDGAEHTIILAGTSAIQKTGSGTLSLTGNLTINASPDHSGSMIIIDGGTLDMSSGTTIEGNGISNTEFGGGINITNKATLNMAGGTIRNCAATTGGGIYASGATINMSGDALVEGCVANGNGTSINGCGAGVFLNKAPSRATTTLLNMSDDATIKDNAAAAKGGGVFVENVTELVMSGNSLIWHNSAHVGGGVMDYGIAKMGAVYDNSAVVGGDDICAADTGQMQVGPVDPSWVLSKTGTNVTGWYYDGYREYTDDSGNATVDERRWVPDDGHGNADAYVQEYAPTQSLDSSRPSLKAGAPVVEIPGAYLDVLWENQDGTVLYRMDDVKKDAAPAADEYGKLSGNADPTEPDTEDGYKHVFTGWFKTQPTIDEIIYIANYRLEAPQPPSEAAETHTLRVHYVDESGHTVAPDHVQTVHKGDAYSVPSPKVDGYEPDRESVDGTTPDGDVTEKVTYHKAAQSPSDDPATDPTDAGVTDDSSGSGNSAGDASDNGGSDANSTQGTASAEPSKSGMLQQTGDEATKIISGLGVASLIAAAAMFIAGRRRARQ